MLQLLRQYFQVLNECGELNSLKGNKKEKRNGMPSPIDKHRNE